MSTRCQRRKKDCWRQRLKYLERRSKAFSNIQIKLIGAPTWFTNISREEISSNCTRKWWTSNSKSSTKTTMTFCSIMIKQSKWKKSISLKKVNFLNQRKIYPRKDLTISILKSNPISLKLKPQPISINMKSDSSTRDLETWRNNLILSCRVCMKKK